ncbi:hypothetical protein GE061_011576 [Apolygus lucorum]|uniref:Uncharacterized protein n=1 Tax=Apolygus lucorum TaxID=248454 RepID=A0A6A4JW64_APOLU|nr:hypothetical protein GE061_011576 [Apolygus lucorum]
MKTNARLRSRFLVAIIWLLYITSCSTNANRRAHVRRKRVFYGQPLPSHSLYNTAYMIELRRTHSCTTEPTEHLLDDCAFNAHGCGGTIIHSRFVMTACHCISYKMYYDLEYERPLPTIHDVDPLSLPGYLDLTHLPIDSKIIEKATAYHPLLNSMTLWAGSTNRSAMTQKRHAASFYPHHYCIEDIAREYDKNRTRQFNYTGYRSNEYDYGLVKSCVPFKFDKNVRLAPLKPTHLLASHLSEIFQISTVCLWMGWGVVPVATDEFHPEGLGTPEILQHQWRYAECSDDCNDRGLRCLFCSHLQGPKFAMSSQGDSGGPVTCNGFVTAIISKGNSDKARNISFTRDVSVACIRHYIYPKYLEALLTYNDEIFHWINGKPVPIP